MGCACCRTEDGTFCCWAERPAKKDPRTSAWRIRLAHTKPLRNVEKSELREVFKELLKKKREEFEKKLMLQCPTDDTSNFELSGVLGQGDLGLVVLGQHKKTGIFYAVEVIRRTRLSDEASIKKLEREKSFLNSFSSEFVVKLICVCEGSKDIYLVKELSIYGDFCRCVTSRIRLDDRDTQIYAAQIVLAIEYLHHCRVVHRDLRSKNLFVFRDGYLKLADFKTAKIVSRHTSTFIGSPSSIPPEMFKGKMYKTAVDWWAVGILLYEMLAGELPFQKADTRKRIQCEKRILQDSPLFNHLFSDKAKDFISRLLEKEPSRRLGSGARGSEDVKDHEYFTGTNFVGILDKKYKINIEFPVFVPTGLPRDESSSSSSESVASSTAKNP